MSEQSTHLGLTWLAAGQAQKHVSVNESLRRLDALVQLAVLSATTPTQPESPADGAVYILPAGKTGSAWGAMANGALAYWRDGSWEQISPREGWLAFVRDVDQLLVHDGAAWSQAALRTGLGLGSAAVRNTGASGANVPLLDGANTWSQGHVWASGSAFLPQNVVRNTSGDAFAGYWILEKSRAGEAVEAGDTVGTLLFRAVDAGAVARNSAIIYAEASAPPVTGHVPTNLFLGVTTSGGQFTNRLRLGDDITLYASTGPQFDNAYTLGSTSFRFAAIYSATGVITTSDAGEKTALRALTAAERRAILRVIGGVGVFQWREAMERKGKDARLHVGVTAQDVETAFAAEGLDARRYGLFCEEELLEEVEEAVAESPSPEAEGGLALPPRQRVARRQKRDASNTPLTRKGVRHDQLFAMALAALAAGR
jgi:Protein of unknown function (DUF2793)